MRLLLYILLACTLFLAGCGCVNPKACFRPVTAAWDAMVTDPEADQGAARSGYQTPTRAPSYTCPPNYNCGGYNWTGGGNYGGAAPGYGPCQTCPQGNPTMF